MTTSLDHPNAEYLAPLTGNGPLAEINQSLLRRERLLAAAATASRLLLETPDVMAAMPGVLRELGEAASVDRTALALAEIGPAGERWLVIKSEWVAEGATGQYLGNDGAPRMAWSARKSDCFCSQLRTGRSVHVMRDDAGPDATSIASDLAKSSMIVPFLVDGEYAGAVGFDDCRQPREFDPAVVSALEIAAGVIGAALYREKLIDAARIERERAAENRAAELTRTNAAMRANLERLASDADLLSFFRHLLLEATRQLGADGGTTVMRVDYDKDEWRVVTHVRDGAEEEPPFARTVPATAEVTEALQKMSRRATHFAIDDVRAFNWPGALDYHHAHGHRSVYVQPLVFGTQAIGFIALAFREHDTLGPEQTELLVALAQQATLAMGIKRLTMSAKNAAVLAERNRIGQEIHDGLAQAFTGILMQLGAAEEMSEGSPLSVTLNRIRDIAKEGLSEARRSVLALKPTESRPGGLEQALKELAERSTVPGRITSRFEGSGTTTGLAPEHEHELLRIAQEAVINAVRHAQPQTIQIALTSEPSFLRLSISDDGCGMEQMPELYAQQGFGLTNMRERAQAIGGAWQIQSAPREGTRINVWIPRPQSA